MVSLNTNLGNLRESARRERVELSGTITATDVQKALENLDAGKLAGNTTTLVVGNLVVSTSFISLGSAVLSTLTVSNDLAVGSAAFLGSLAVTNAATVFGNATVSALTVTNSARVGSLTVTTTAAVLGALTGTAGSVTRPGYAFNADNSSGMYLIGVSNIGWAVSSSKIFDISMLGMAITGVVTVSGNATVSSGSVATPGYAFNASTSSGMYLVGVGNIGWAINGVKIFDISSLGMAVTGVLTLTGAATVSALTVSTSAVVFGAASVSSLTVSNDLGVVSAAFIGSLAVTNSATVFGNTTVSALTVTNAARVGSLVVTTTATILGATTISSLTVTNATTALGGLVGTTTSDNAAAGRIGEYIESNVLTGSAVTLATGTPLNVTFVALTAGDWDVGCNGYFRGGATTQIAFAAVGVSTTSGTVDATNGRLNLSFLADAVPFGTVNQIMQPVPPVRFSLNATTTVYMVANVSFITSSCFAFGLLSARRVR